MKRQNRKVLCRIYLCMALLFGGCFGGLSACGEEEPVQSTDAEKKPENPDVMITFFDVGKGDAILIETGKHNMLIDSGYDDTAEVILDHLESEGIDQLDYMLITHFDKDHVGGADRILEAVRVETILQPDYESDGKQYREYKETMEKKKIQPYLVTETINMSLDEAEFLIYPPQRQLYEEEDNDFSLVVSMRYGEKSFLFAGDSERERLQELLNQKEFPLSHDVLKAPHHGRTEKNSEEFFLAVSPEIAIITCSEDKPADKEIYLLLENIGTKVYTSAEGTITCLCDGKNLEIQLK